MISQSEKKKFYVHWSEPSMDIKKERIKQKIKSVQLGLRESNVNVLSSDVFLQLCLLNFQNKEGCLFTPRTPACVFWSLETSTWSSLGCKVFNQN